MLQNRRLRTSVQEPGKLPVPPRGASAELEGLTGVWAAVKYLVSVGSANTDLIKAHARCGPLCRALQSATSGSRQAANALQNAACTILFGQSAGVVLRCEEIYYWRCGPKTPHSAKSPG